MIEFVLRTPRANCVLSRKAKKAEPFSFSENSKKRLSSKKNDISRTKIFGLCYCNSSFTRDSCFPLSAVHATADASDGE